MKALRIFNEVKAPFDDVHVKAAVSYLLTSFDYKKGLWHALPKEANSAPHAPWWDFHGDTGKCEVESPVFPTAAIVAATLPIVLLIAVIAGRIGMVVTDLYPVDSFKQIFAIVLGTSLVAVFVVSIRLKWCFFTCEASQGADFRLLPSFVEGQKFTGGARLAWSTVRSKNLKDSPTPANVS